MLHNRIPLLNFAREFLIAFPENLLFFNVHVLETSSDLKDLAKKVCLRKNTELLIAPYSVPIKL